MSYYGTGNLGVWGCGLDSSGATGFCECLGDWVPYDDSTGACRPPCYVAGQDSTDGTDECWPNADVADEDALRAAVNGCQIQYYGSNAGTPTNPTIGSADYYCECDTVNGFFANTDDGDGTCIRGCLKKGYDNDGGTPPTYYDQCWQATDVTSDFVATVNTALLTMQVLSDSYAAGSFYGCYYVSDTIYDTSTPRTINPGAGFCMCDNSAGYY